MTDGSADGSGSYNAINRRVDRLEDGTTRIMNDLTELKELVGRAPDPATGRAGSGIAAVVAGLATKRSLVGASAAGASGAVGLIWAIFELLFR